GMVGWWPFDGDATDIWGQHDGLPRGIPQWTGGEVPPPPYTGAYGGDGVYTTVEGERCRGLGARPGRGVSVAGSGSPVNVTNAAPLVEWDDITNPIPQGVQFWLGTNFTSITGNGGPGSLAAQIWDTNGTAHIIATPPLQVTNAGWQHVALTYDAATR